MSIEERVPVTFRLPAKVKEQIERLAEQERRSLNEQMVFMLEQALLAHRPPAANGKQKAVAA